MMYPSFFDAPHRIGAALVLAAAVLAGGCATVPSGDGGPVERKAAKTRPSDHHDDDEAVAGRAALVEVETDIGFTVTEVVSIPGSVRNDHREALARIAAEDYEEGIRLMRQIIDKVPDATGPLVDLGIAHARAGDLEAAAASFEAALALTPNHPVAHNELGIVQRQLGHFPAARASYERALEVYPGFHFARRNLAVLCDLYLADLDCALTNYEVYRASVAEDREVDIWIADIRNRLGEGG